MRVNVSYRSDTGAESKSNSTTQPTEILDRHLEIVGRNVKEDPSIKHHNNKYEPYENTETSDSISLTLRSPKLQREFTSLRVEKF